MVRSGLTYSRIVEVLKQRRIRVGISNVRNVVAGVTKRHDIRQVVAELTGQPVERLWPDAALQEVA